MMMTSEMILNETKKTAVETMGDASECVPPALATLMRQNARASAPPRASQAPEQNNTLQNPRAPRPQMAAVDLRQRGS
jgi:hypothetical protein